VLGDSKPRASIWTKPIELPPWLERPARIARIWLTGLLVIAVVVNLFVFVYGVYSLWPFRPGARLMLTERASVRVPAHFSGFVSERDERDVLISYALHPASEDSPGGIVSVEAVRPGASLGYRDRAVWRNSRAARIRK
jgi:hypothetical protein